MKVSTGLDIALTTSLSNCSKQQAVAMPSTNRNGIMRREHRSCRDGFVRSDAFHSLPIAYLSLLSAKAALTAEGYVSRFCCSTSRTGLHTATATEADDVGISSSHHQLHYPDNQTTGKYYPSAMIASRLYQKRQSHAAIDSHARRTCRSRIEWSYELSVHNGFHIYLSLNESQPLCS